MVLHEAGLFGSAVNLLLIKERSNNSLRKDKTDKADAMKIARYGLDNWAELRNYTPVNTIRYDLKTLSRQFQLAPRQETATANKLIASRHNPSPAFATNCYLIFLPGTFAAAFCDALFSTFYLQILLSSSSFGA